MRVAREAVARAAFGCVLLTLVAAAPAAARRTHAPCRSGRFLVAGPPLVADGAAGAGVLVLDGGTLTMGTCTATRTRVRATARGTRVVARFASCHGLPGRALLRATADAACARFDGRLRGRGLSRAFTAARTRCGDRVVDAGAGEQCEDLTTCADCDLLACRCGGAAPLACAPAPGRGSAVPAAPLLVRTLADRWQEAWLGSPAVADLDGDGGQEIVVPRHDRVVVWRPDGSVAWSAAAPAGGRIWASPVVADFTGDGRLEVAVASRRSLLLYDAAGALVPGFPVEWRDEVRSLAAGDLDADGRPELVAVTTSPLSAGGRRDVVLAVRGDGTIQPGFPPNTSGTSGCDDACYVTGGYDQNVAVGPIDGDAAMDVLVGQDNAYLSWHRGNGVAFDAAPIFDGRTKVPGIRFLHDYALAQQGWADDEERADQAHFTNSAPAIADVDGDGTSELVVLGSVQNAAQTDRLRGVALWVLRADGTRPPAWVAPFHAPEYLAGLWDFDGTNVVAATNQVAVADLDPAVPGLDMVFAGFDGRIHRVGADRVERFVTPFTTADDVLTAGVAIADLSGDGRPEIVFATYSPTPDRAALIVLDANGTERHRVPLPGRGAMPVPTIADVDGDGALEIVVSLKDGEDRERAVLVFTVPGSTAGCLPWPTGRANLLRNGWVR